MIDVDNHGMEGLALGLEEKMRRPIDIDELRGLVEIAYAAAQLAWQIEGRSPETDLLLAHMARQLEERINEQRKMAMRNLRDTVPRVGKAKVIRWPARLEKKLHRAGDDQDLRARAEGDERAR